MTETSTAETELQKLEQKWHETIKDKDLDALASEAHVIKRDIERFARKHEGLHRALKSEIQTLLDHHGIMPKTWPGLKNLKAYLVGSDKSVRLLVCPSSFEDCFHFGDIEIPIAGWFAKVSMAFGSAAHIGPVVPFIEDDLTSYSVPLQVIIGSRWHRQQFFKAMDYWMHMDGKEIMNQIDLVDEFQSAKLAAILLTIGRQFRSVWEALLTNDRTIVSFGDELAASAIRDFTLGIDAGVPEDEEEEIHFWSNISWKRAAGVVLLVALIIISGIFIIGALIT